MALGKYVQHWTLFIDINAESDVTKEDLQMFLNSFHTKFKFIHTQGKEPDNYYVAEVTVYENSVVRLCRFADALVSFAMYHGIHVVESKH